MPSPRPEAARRIRLHSHARPLRRGPGQVQFGLSPEHGVVLEGLTDAEVGWLLSLALQRSGAGRDLELVSGGTPAAAELLGVSGQRVAELLDLLHRHDLIASRADGTPLDVGGKGTAREASWRISILGSGRTTESIRAGVSTVESVEVWDALLPNGPPDAALLVVNDTVGPSDAASWARSNIRHVPVIVDRHRVRLGPVVTPGRGPCLVCLDLRRADRDPAWPLVAAQLDTAPSEWAQPVTADPALTAAATGLCAVLVDALSRGAPVPAGVTWEVSEPLPQVTTRHWLQHPLCPVHRTETMAAPPWNGRPEVGPHAAC